MFERASNHTWIKPQRYRLRWWYLNFRRNRISKVKIPNGWNIEKFGNIKKFRGVPDFYQLGLRYMVIKFYFMAEVNKFRMSKTVCNNRILLGFVILSDEGYQGSDFRKCRIERCQMDFENNWWPFDQKKWPELTPSCAEWFSDYGSLKP